MKRTASILAVLMLAAPAWAAITVSAGQEPNSNEVVITYEMDSEDADLLRAFTMDINVSGPNAVIGPLYGFNKDYYYHIYPSSIAVVDGAVVDYGVPIAGCDHNSVTVEAGLLYDADDPQHQSPPPDRGILCRFTVGGDPGSTVTLNITGNAIGDGVTMKDAGPILAEGYVTYLGCQVRIAETTCQCYGSIGCVIPEGCSMIDLGNFTAMSMELMAYPHTGHVISPVPPGLECGDIADSTAIGCPDGQIDLGDFTAMAIYLMGYEATGYVAPCMTLPPGC